MYAGGNKNGDSFVENIVSRMNSRFRQAMVLRHSQATSHEIGRRKSICKGPRKRTEEDNEKFMESLDRLLVRVGGY